jgi:hypothetical protein
MMHVWAVRRRPMGDANKSRIGGLEDSYEVWLRCLIILEMSDTTGRVWFLTTNGQGW